MRQENRSGVTDVGKQQLLPDQNSSELEFMAQALCIRNATGLRVHKIDECHRHIFICTVIKRQVNVVIPGTASRSELQGHGLCRTVRPGADVVQNLEQDAGRTPWW